MHRVAATYEISRFKWFHGDKKTENSIRTGRMNVDKLANHKSLLLDEFVKER